MKYKFSLIENNMVLWKIWSNKRRIWLSETISMKSVLWVYHRIIWIRNRTSNEEEIKKRKIEIKEKRKKKKWRKIKMMMLMDRENEGKMRKVNVYIKVINIHFNPSGKFAFKSNSFSCNLVLNCNLIRKLIPNWN